MENATYNSVSLSLSLSPQLCLSQGRKQPSLTVLLSLSRGQRDFHTQKCITAPAVCSNLSSLRPPFFFAFLAVKKQNKMASGAKYAPHKVFAIQAEGRVEYGILPILVRQHSVSPPRYNPRCALRLMVSICTGVPLPAVCWCAPDKPPMYKYVCLYACKCGPTARRALLHY